MSDAIEEIKSLLGKCTDDERRDVMAWLRERHPVHNLERGFGASAELILEAIARASDLSQRGVLGLIAEASFKVNVIDKLHMIDGLAGWTNDPVEGDAAFDFRLRRGDQTARIQVKRQRLVRRQPMRYTTRSKLYAVETQRSRKGIERKTGEDTRPYRFGDFDIVAVSMQPVTQDWSSFRYAPQRWLIPRGENPSYLKVIQPVSLEPNDDWTDSLAKCVGWFEDGLERRISAS